MLMKLLRDPAVQTLLTVIVPIVSGLGTWILTRRREARQQGQQEPVSTSLPPTEPETSASQQQQQRKSNRTRHSVWEVYDLLRTVRLNVLYWSVKLDAAQRRGRYPQIALAVLVPTSTFLWTLALQSTSWATLTNWIWGTLLFASVALAVAIPFLNVPEFVRAYEASVARYRTLEIQLRELQREIFYSKKYDSTMRGVFRYIERTMRNAADIEPAEESTDDTLRDRLTHQVRAEFPPEEFYVPDD